MDNLKDGWDAVFVEGRSYIAAYSDVAEGFHHNFSFSNLKSGVRNSVGEKNVFSKHVFFEVVFVLS